MPFDSPREACGIFGVYGADRAAPLIYRGLFSLQHRGQEGAGIVVSNGHVRSFKGEGLVSNVFTKSTIDQLHGSLGIGHVRYSTTGSTRIQNVQPLVVETYDGAWAVAHNGNLVNAKALRSMYQEGGAIFQTTTDSEILLHLLADPLFRSRPGRVPRALGELRGAFAFLLMTPDRIMAARDPHGFRPLCIGRHGTGWVFASETCALQQTQSEYVRDVRPGELVTAGPSGLESVPFADPLAGGLAQCVFELIYFARPDSAVFGENVHAVRLEYGKRLAQELPVEADVVIPVPDSGSSAALGFSRESGIPLDYGFIRNHYIGRTFIMPEMGDRTEGVDMKLSILPPVVEGKRVVVVDDSIVRGTTARFRVRRLREAGAKEIHMRISCPPISHPCFFGIDFPTREELAAGVQDIEAIRNFIGVDTLGYLSVDGLLAPLARPRDYCLACFSGVYPDSLEIPTRKRDLERGVLSCDD